MDNQKPGGKQFSDQVNKMLATAKEMETVLNSKLEQIDKLSNEKSEMAKKEAMKIKTDLEEIRRLSLVKTAEGEEALKTKIMEVNKRIETITRKAAETQTQIVKLQKELMDEAAAKAEDVKTAIDSIEVTPEEKARMMKGVDAVVNQTTAKFNELNTSLETLKTEMGKAKELKPDPKMTQEEVMKTIQGKIDEFLTACSKSDSKGCKK
ncbi:Hypothetical protein NTJ_07230 [Nesidiocoris tenuis]|uniref:Uncharacterized protein n=1 Tax=Nesidiocoris tenuis TaxID=355587 RepID=A0ABN7AQD4_9HEMI|nr:Hypothetical protein NTJ_07230 [Nesidiocoris tenuis]